jgi:hypothetical protein
VDFALQSTSIPRGQIRDQEQLTPLIDRVPRFSGPGTRGSRIIDKNATEQQFRLGVLTGRETSTRSLDLHLMAVSRTPPVPPVTTQPKLTGKGSNGRPPVRYAASARKQYATIHHPSTSLLATVIAKTPIDNFHHRPPRNGSGHRTAEVGRNEPRSPATEPVHSLKRLSPEHDLGRAQLCGQKPTPPGGPESSEEKKISAGRLEAVKSS